MPKYTVEFAATPLVRSKEDGEEIEFTATILRDGVGIDSIEQRYGVAMTDEEMQLDLRRQVDRLILEDYATIKRTETKDRADATVAIFDMFEVDLP